MSLVTLEMIFLRTKSKSIVISIHIFLFGRFKKGNITPGALQAVIKSYNNNNGNIRTILGVKFSRIWSEVV